MQDNNFTEENSEKIEQAKQMFNDEKYLSGSEENLKTNDSTVKKGFLPAVIFNIIVIIVNALLIYCILSMDNSSFNTAGEVFAFLFGWPFIMALVSSFISSIEFLKTVKQTLRAGVVSSETIKKRQFVKLTFSASILSIMLVTILFTLRVLVWGK